MSYPVRRLVSLAVDTPTLVTSLPNRLGLHRCRGHGELHIREHLSRSNFESRRATPSTPSALRRVAPTTMASADFSLRLVASPFQAQGEISPGKNAILPRTTAGFTPPDP